MQAEDLDVPPEEATERVDERTVVRESYGRFSIVAGFLGWSVAAFFTLVLTSLTLTLLGDSAFLNPVVSGNTVTISQTTINNLAWAGIAGMVLAIFVSFFLGGYNAGRIDGAHGPAQGLVVVAWTLVLSFVGAVIVNAAVRTFDVGYYIQAANVDWSTLTAKTLVAALVALAVMIAGAMLGGMVGEGRFRRSVSLEERQSRTYWRGRPRV